MKKAIILLVALMLVLAGCGQSSAPEPQSSGDAPAAPATSGSDAAAEPGGWVPEKDIEMVIPFSAGGGSDVFARKTIEIISKYNLCPVNIIANNKPGGSGVVGYTYMNGKGVDNYTIATTSSSFYSQPLSGNSPLSCYDDFSFVAHLCKDPNLVVAHPGRGFETLDDMVQFAKENPGVLKYAGTGNVSDDAILMYMMNHLLEIEIVYVPYDSGGEVLASVLGGHIDLCAISPAEAGEHLTAGTLVPLAVSADERLDIVADVPTFLELGVDMDHQQSRGVVMNAGVDPEVVAYYSDLFRQVTETDDWKEFVEENAMDDEYMDSAAYEIFNDELADRYKMFLGIILAD